MNKGLIIYCSYHHGNTEKLVRGICKINQEIQVVSLLASKDLPDLSNYEFIGLASGVYMGKPHEALLKFITDNQSTLKNKKLFTILTSGSNQESYEKWFNSFVKEQGLQLAGSYRCKGFDTYGFWRYIGGISKSHPNQKDISDLYARICL